MANGFFLGGAAEGMQSAADLGIKRDTLAQDLLYIYAQRRRSVDAEFSDDLEAALVTAGYTPPTSIGHLRARAQITETIKHDLDGKGESLMKEAWEDCDTDELFADANKELRRILWLLGEHV